MEWYLESELRLLGKNSIQYSKQFIENIPINNSDKQIKNSIVSLVEQMIATQKELQATKTESDKKTYHQKADLIDRQIDKLVYKLYDLDEKEIEIVEQGCQ